MRRLYLLILLTISLCGCTKHIGTLPYISNREIRDDTRKVEKIGSNISGEDVRWYLLLYFTSSPPRLDMAVEDALAKSGGDYISNVKVNYTWFFIPALYYRYSIEVVGDVWKIKSAAQVEKL
jgi:hypothetical protein